MGGSLIKFPSKYRKEAGNVKSPSTKSRASPVIPALLRMSGGIVEKWMASIFIE